MNALSPALDRFGDVSVRLAVELGKAEMPLREVLALGEGSVVSLDRMTDELLDLTANGKVIAKGEVVAQDGRFSLRIVSIPGSETGQDSGGSDPGSGEAANPSAPVAVPAPAADANAMPSPVGGA